MASNLLKAGWRVHGFDINPKLSGIAKDTADRLSFPCQIASVALQAFAERAAQGGGQHDNSSVVCNYKDITGQIVADPEDQEITPLPAKKASPTRLNNQYHETQLGLSENASWHEAIHWPGAKQAGYVGRLFESLSKDQFNGLRPARQYLRSPEGIEGEDILSYTSNRYIADKITQGRYWIYTGYGDAFGVDLAGVVEDWGYQNVEVETQWFDLRTAHTDRAEHKVPERDSSNKAIFTPLSSGGVDHDWVLILKFVSRFC
ncbi:hypothetical protein BDV19DRAFT_393477 [Aspergillus venezuelensis]